MDKELIEHLAKEAGLAWLPFAGGHVWVSRHTEPPLTDLTRFVTLIAEECAKVCEAEDDSKPADGYYSDDEGWQAAAAYLAKAIRERFKSDA